MNVNDLVHNQLDQKVHVTRTKNIFAVYSIYIQLKCSIAALVRLAIKVPLVIFTTFLLYAS